MNYNIEVTTYFSKQLKRLSKRYPSLKTEFSALVNSLRESPEQGTPIGKNCFKIRLAIASKNKGKSAGARIIAHVQIIQTKVYLLSIYDKSEQSTISEKELEELLKHIPE